MKHTKKIGALSLAAALALSLAAPAAAAEYTVQSGDSLWKIARQRLGDGTRWGGSMRPTGTPSGTPA